MAIKIKIEGFENFPPSKNQFYFGKAIKSRWVAYFRKEYNAEIQEIQRLLRKHKWVIVEITFGLTENRYTKFEPQNYTESIYDAIFGIHQDHRITKIVITKRKDSQNNIEIVIKPAPAPEKKQP